MKKIIEKSLLNAMDYKSFKSLVSELVKQEKSTGETQSEALLNYSVLSERRMKRLDKTIKINDITKHNISKINKEIIFLVLMESWCGDGAQTLPIMHKITELSSNIDFKVVLRDDNEALMNQFLTNGGKAIPKLLIIERDSLKVLQDWGPRPSVATKMVADYKEKYGALDATFKKDLQVWYNKDKGITTQSDLVEILESIK